MLDLNLHHVGVAVNSIEAATAFWELTGFKSEGLSVVDEVIGVKVQFFKKDGFRVELVEPLSGESPAVAWIEKKAPIYHFAYEITEENSTAEVLKSQKFIKVFGPVKALALDNRTVTFFMRPDGLLIELISTK